MASAAVVSTGASVAGGEEPRCFKCKSRYKVSEFEGLMVCSGLCRKNLFNFKEAEREAAKKNAATTSASAANASGNTGGGGDGGQAADGSDDTQTNGIHEWKVGDHCRAVFTDDGQEYEATVESVETSEDGHPFCIVQFVGYGNQETHWAANLKVSAGEEARKAQADSVAPAETNEEVAKPEADAQVVVEAEQVAAETEAAVTAEAATIERVKESSETAAPAADSGFSVGDFCRAVYTADGLEYEGVIQSTDADQDGVPYAVVKFLGYGNEETQWMANLLPSQGEAARKEQALAASGEEAAEEAGSAAENQAEQATSVPDAAAAGVAAAAVPDPNVAVADAATAPAASVAVADAAEANVVPAQAGTTATATPSSSHELKTLADENERLRLERDGLTKHLQEVETQLKGEIACLNQKVDALRKGNRELNDELEALNKSKAAGGSSKTQEDLDKAYVMNLEKYKMLAAEKEKSEERLKERLRVVAAENEKLHRELKAREDAQAGFKREKEQLAERCDALADELRELRLNNRPANNSSSGSVANDVSSPLNCVTPGAAMPVAPFMMGGGVGAGGDVPGQGQQQPAFVPMMFCVPMPVPSAAMMQQGIKFPQVSPVNPGGRTPLRRPLGDAFNPQAPAFQPNMTPEK